MLIWVGGFKQGEPVRLTFDELSPGAGSDQAMLDSWIFITSKKKIFSMIQRLDAHADAVNCAEDTLFSAKYVSQRRCFLLLIGNVSIWKNFCRF